MTSTLPICSSRAALTRAISRVLSTPNNCRRLASERIIDCGKYFLIPHTISQDYSRHLSKSPSLLVRENPVCHVFWVDFSFSIVHDEPRCLFSCEAQPFWPSRVFLRPATLALLQRRD